MSRLPQRLQRRAVVALAWLVLVLSVAPAVAAPALRPLAVYVVAAPALALASSAVGGRRRRFRAGVRRAPRERLGLGASDGRGSRRARAARGARVTPHRARPLDALPARASARRTPPVSGPLSPHPSSGAGSELALHTGGRHGTAFPAAIARRSPAARGARAHRPAASRVRRRAPGPSGERRAAGGWPRRSALGRPRSRPPW